MALGDFLLFSWKSKATLEREQKEYDAWAFPHGPQQRENLQALMMELYPKEQGPFLLMGFLTCKELYERILEDTGSQEQTIQILVIREKKYKNLIRKNEMPRYVAFVIADSQIGADCIYPTPDEMRRRIAEIEALDAEKKKG